MIDENEYPGITQFYELTPQGHLGFYDKNGFMPDTRLSRMFKRYSEEYLKHFFQDMNEYTLGTVEKPSDKNKWKTATLVLSDDALDILYNPGNRVLNSEKRVFTPYQLKKRDMGIYQGMEMLLKFKDPTNNDRHKFCPLIFDEGNNVRIIDYTKNLAFQGREDERITELRRVISKSIRPETRKPLEFRLESVDLSSLRNPHK